MTAPLLPVFALYDNGGDTLGMTAWVDLARPRPEVLDPRVGWKASVTDIVSEAVKCFAGREVETVVALGQFPLRPDEEAILRHTLRPRRLFLPRRGHPGLPDAQVMPYIRYKTLFEVGWLRPLPKHYLHLLWLTWVEAIERTRDAHRVVPTAYDWVLA